jgi:hypothetical protein
MGRAQLPIPYITMPIDALFDEHTTYERNPRVTPESR